MLSTLQYVYAAIGIVVAAVVSPIILLVSIQWTRTYNAPPQIPWAGLKDKKIFPKLRANLREMTAGREPIDEGYEEYGKHGKAFVLPALHWPEVALPASNLHWIASQPENVLSQRSPQDDTLTLGDFAHGPDMDAIYDFSVISRDLTRQSIHILPDILDEVKVSFEEYFDSDMDDWKDVKIFKVIFRVARRTNNRMLVGRALCRDEKYIRGLTYWEAFFGIASAAIRYLVPYSVKHLIAPIFGIPTFLLQWYLARMILPMIRSRMTSQSQTGDSKGSVERPNDALQWIIDSTKRRGGTQGMSQHDIAGKTILFNFFAVHTTSMSAGMILTDILCHSSAESLIAELREEADAIMPKLESDPRAVRDMIKLDSVIRESLRLNTFVARALQREVVQPGGVTTPDGLHLPQGTHISTIISAMQRDDEVWERANEFVPLRFYKGEKERQDPEEKQWSAVHVTEQYLSFGFGRHACPGRFFAVQTLKLFLGYLLTRYDFEPLKERPKVLKIGDAVVQKQDNTIKARRRKIVDEKEDDVM